MADEQPQSYPPSDDRRERFCGILPTQTINDAFGDLKVFLKFLYAKSTLYKDMTDSGLDYGSIETIVKGITDAITREAESLGEKQVKEAKKLEDILRNPDVLKAHHFLYKAIVNVYTQETFLYGHVNRLLLEEAWDKLNNLFPFVFYLAIALLDLRTDGIFDTKDCKHKDQRTIYLYRGTRVSPDLIEFYNPQKTKYFSWNSFVSTTKKQERALEYLEKPQGGLCSISFVMEVPIDSEQVIDISMYSAFQEEAEVLLVPGTIFEIIGYQQVQNNLLVNLRIIPLPKRLYNIAHIDQLEGLSLRSEAITSLERIQNFIRNKSEELFITELVDRDVADLIDLLMQGNDFIQQITLGRLHFSAIGMEQVMKALCDLENLQKINFNDINLSVEAAKVFADYLPKTRAKTLLFGTQTINLLHPEYYLPLYNNYNLLQNLTPNYGQKVHQFIAIIKALMSNNSFEALDALEFHSGNEDRLLTKTDLLLSTLLEGMQKSKLNKLILAYFNVKCLGPWLIQSNVKELCLYGCEEVGKLVSYIKGSKIKHLSLYSCNIDFSTMQSLVEALAESSIESLVFIKNNLAEYEKSMLCFISSLLKLKLTKLRIEFFSTHSGLKEYFKCFSKGLSQSCVKDLTLNIRWDEQKDREKWGNSWRSLLSGSSSKEWYGPKKPGFNSFDFEPILSFLSGSNIESFTINARITFEDLSKLIKILPQTKLTSLYFEDLYNYENSQNTYLSQCQKQAVEDLRNVLPLTKIKNLGILDSKYARVFDNSSRLIITQILKDLNINEITRPTKYHPRDTNIY